jgi:hypothetical protein
LSYLPAQPNGEHALRESLPPVTPHELHVAELPPSGTHELPPSPPLLVPLLLAPLLLAPLLLAPLLLVPLLLVPLLLVPLLLPESSLGPASMMVGPGLSLLLLHATAAAAPAIATSAIAEAFRIIGFDFITRPHSSQSGTSGSRRCTLYLR